MSKKGRLQRSADSTKIVGRRVFPAENPDDKGDVYFHRSRQARRAQYHLAPKEYVDGKRLRWRDLTDREKLSL